MGEIAGRLVRLSGRRSSSSKGGEGGGGRWREVEGGRQAVDVKWAPD